ncbi:hypothetical protein [Thiocapsa sp.]|uniref:hypothetical protein n=1 Tax=Thiocapsa sp. TaxID=2024551 RepID=UPI0025D957A6|nr:hypothetical protein [Thiocapsa sp.]
MRTRPYLTIALHFACVATLLLPLSGCDAVSKGDNNGGRTIYADVVALDQPLIYNRFGSYNPYGMIYALARDVVHCPPDAAECAEALPDAAEKVPGEVRLQADKRPRPLVLRGGVGDTLVISFTNLLQPTQPDFSDGDGDDRGAEPDSGTDMIAAKEIEVAAKGGPETPDDDGRLILAEADDAPQEDGGNNWPTTRRAGITISGMAPDGDTFDPKVTGLTGVEPGETVVYRYKLERPGTFLFFSNDAPAGGQGDGSSLTHGLFGVVNVTPAGSRLYRSQVTAEQLALARAAATGDAFLDYEALDANGDPVLNMLKPRPDKGKNAFELVHGDINAIVVDNKSEESPAFREFTVVFHDELKTFYRDEFQELENFGQLAGIGDGFAINYGASGMGSILLANRKGIGPAADCKECLYEEFFLQSWANGDPALLPTYADDPANVHHSYLNDRVEFRNLHAGPKETHVFHLHAHQWLSQRESGTGSYLDSQTIAPQQGFSYPIEYGGSGNRNLTPGDSIFHCHLYPHFAQGMWALWRAHDVLEDGTRRLPDGELGSGTDPLNGKTVADSGTPIPAVVPLPGQAMPPEPDYAAGLPGYPFYIAGKAGRRAPQPPLDLAEDAGLPRHIVEAGTRGLSGLSAAEAASMSPDALVEYAVRSGDFSGVLESAVLNILPADGTPLEQAAMDFHAQPSVPSRRPDGSADDFVLNGMPPQPGAPFADPCRLSDGWNGLDPVQYRVSAIQTDLIVNQWGWHDPQARINVLDEDVERFEDKRTAEAKPFFFRAHSGDCIEFFHTNRTPYELELDDFQVRTPTDTIGQHIHLVKFDVTSSDGSGNGFNYEDGTFAIEAVHERIEASHAPGGSAVDAVSGEAMDLAIAPDVYQTTVQRWLADPLIASEGSLAGKDRTIRTVFTHDHFAPSSIQQHGFYAALLIEPAGSEWLPPDNDTPMERGRAVGSQARIVGADDPETHPDHREFAMAIADFALLYDPCFGRGGEERLQAGDGADCEAGGGEPQGLEGLLADAPEVARDAVLERLTEVRSEHGKPVAPPEKPEAISKDHHDPYLVNYRNEPIPLRVAEGPSNSVKQQKSGPEGDMALVFDTATHGDPGTELFEAYEGDRAQIRIVQGAQEVQHMFAVHGLRWRREMDNPQSPYVGAQEIGISEHFEMRLPAFNNVQNFATDYLYKVASVDALWNGAWGLIRTYNGTDQTDERLKPLPDNPDGRLTFDNAGDFDPQTGCPLDAPVRRFAIEAWQAKDLTGGTPLAYDPRHGITDEHALVFISAEDGPAIRSGVKALEPLVIRANAGDCIKVALTNKLPQTLPDDPWDALMPRIVPFNVGRRVGDPPSDAGDLQPSSNVTLHPQLVSYNAAIFDGALTGVNDAAEVAAPGATANFTWYAGILEQDGNALVATPYAFGPVNLVSYGDAISHGVSGLIGALVIEEEGAEYLDPTSAEPIGAGSHALIRGADGRVHHEIVLLFQDGLNLQHNGEPVPDCLVCDDSYDLGEQGVSYRSAPFWARLGRSRTTDLNGVVFPPDFLLPSHGEIATPRIEVPEGADVVFHVLQPAGRARQRAFLVYGHEYQDMLPFFGSAHASLVSVEKAVTARLKDGARPGCWIYRDGPNHLWAGGVWGTFVVGDAPVGSACRVAQN